MSHETRPPSPESFTSLNRITVRQPTLTLHNIRSPTSTLNVRVIRLRIRINALNLRLAALFLLRPLTVKPLLLLPICRRQRLLRSIHSYLHDILARGVCGPVTYLLVVVPLQARRTGEHRGLAGLAVGVYLTGDETAAVVRVLVETVLGACALGSDDVFFGTGDCGGGEGGHG